MAAQVLTLSRQWDAGLKGTRYVVALMDFNCPGARDTIKMPAMFAQAASLSNVFGHANTCLLAWMPSLPKDNSVSTVDDDEQLIRSLLSKAGFKTQLRIRMMLEPPDSAKNMTHQLDWWADARLCFCGDGHDNFWRLRSELAHTRAVKQQPQLPETANWVDLSSLNPDEDINAGDRIHDIGDKVAQRGPVVAAAQLDALLTRSSLKVAGDKWLTVQDESLIVDFHPCVGDRALGTHRLVGDGLCFRHSPAHPPKGGV